MPINVYRSTSGIVEKNPDRSSFVRKPCLRNNYLESYVEDDIDLKTNF